jgi:hypothetical protein
MASHENSLEIPQRMDRWDMTNEPEDFPVKRAFEQVDQACPFQGEGRSPGAEHERTGGLLGALLAPAFRLWSGIACLDILPVPRSVTSYPILDNDFTWIPNGDSR